MSYMSDEKPCRTAPPSKGRGRSDNTPGKIARRPPSSGDEPIIDFDGKSPCCRRNKTSAGRRPFREPWPHPVWHDCPHGSAHGIRTCCPRQKRCSSRRSLPILQRGHKLQQTIEVFSVRTCVESKDGFATRRLTFAGELLEGLWENCSKGALSSEPVCGRGLPDRSARGAPRRSRDGRC